MVLILLLSSADSSSLVGWFSEQLLARPFVLAIFFLVLVFVIYQAWRVTRETRACRFWIANDDDRSDGQVVQQLRLFLEESERWRHQGIAVAMTDYSDRIDSLIEGLTDQLHNGVNLFLIVGLAGTFFGMAEFARQAPLISGSTDARDVLEALKNALGQSFPVGFVGLCLTIVVHPFADWFEAHLRRATKDAVNHALRLRTANLNQDASGIAELLGKLPGMLQSTLYALQASTVEQLKPLLDIPKAIHDTQSELLDPLRRVFTESRKEWSDTVAKLNKQSNRTAEALEKLEFPINTLTSKIAQITDLVDANEKAVNRINSKSEELASLLLSLQEQIRGTVGEIGACIRDFAVLPEDLRTHLKDAGKSLIDSVRLYYEKIGEEYVVSLRDLAAANSSEITAASARASQSVVEAAESLRISADSMTPLLQTAITAGANLLSGHLVSFNTAFSEHFPGAVEKLAQTLSVASEQIDLARRILESMAVSADSSSEHARLWSEVSSRLADLQREIRADTDQIGTFTGHIRDSATTFSALSPAIEESTLAFKNLAGNLREMGNRSKRRPKSPKEPWWKSLFGTGRNGHDGA